MVLQLTCLVVALVPYGMRGTGEPYQGLRNKGHSGRCTDTSVLSQQPATCWQHGAAFEASRVKSFTPHPQPRHAPGSYSLALCHAPRLYCKAVCGVVGDFSLHFTDCHRRDSDTEGMCRLRQDVAVSAPQLNAKAAQTHALDASSMQ
jgi:hypothetical protein